MIVLDASVIVTGLVDRQSSARPYVERNDLHVPQLADQEVMSAIRRLAISGNIPGADANAYVASWAAMHVTRHPTSHLIADIWALRNNLTPYDATYVVLAVALGTSLATMDANLANAPGIACPIVRP